MNSANMGARARVCECVCVRMFKHRNHQRNVFNFVFALTHDDMTSKDSADVFHSVASATLFVPTVYDRFNLCFHLNTT